MKQNETGFQRKLRERLEEEVGGFWWKVHGGMFQMSGLPDICGCVCGLYIAIETKYGKNGLSEVQHTRIKQINEAGGLAFGCWETQLEWAIRKVKRYVEKHAIQSPEESRKIIRKEKRNRIIHGARDWEDNHRFRTGRTERNKKK